MSVPAPEIDALRERWCTFLAKILVTFDQTVAAAESELLELVAPANDGGLQPFLIAWGAVRQQLMGLTDKIDTTWEAQVLPKMRAADESFDELAEGARGTDTTEQIFARLERLDIELNGKAALRVLDIAERSTTRELRCQECQATLTIEGELYTARYVDCHFCRKRNTYEPSTDLREVAWFAVDHLARYRALGEWDALQRAHEAHTRERAPVPDSVLESRRAAHRAHSERYLKERIRIRPDLTRTYEKDLAALLDALHG